MNYLQFWLLQDSQTLPIDQSEPEHSSRLIKQWCLFSHRNFISLMNVSPAAILCYPQKQKPQNIGIRKLKQVYAHLVKSLSAQSSTVCPSRPEWKSYVFGPRFPQLSVTACPGRITVYAGKTGAFGSRISSLLSPVGQQIEFQLQKNHDSAMEVASS